MKEWFGIGALVALSSCTTLPPTHDPEGCDRTSESAKRAGSDLVVDGDLYCATDDGDCQLNILRKISGSASASQRSQIVVHILREEAAAYSAEFVKRREIAFCYPAEMWFPSKGHYVGRYYLRQEVDGRFQMAFYPRVAKEY